MASKKSSTTASSKHDIDFLVYRMEQLEKRMDTLVNQIGKRVDFMEHMMLQHQRSQSISDVLAPTSATSASAASIVTASDLEPMIMRLVEQVKAVSASQTAAGSDSTQPSVITIECSSHVEEQHQEQQKQNLSVEPLAMMRRRTLI